MRNVLKTVSTSLPGSFVKLAVAGVLVTTLAACDHYLSRRDTIDMSAGSAVRSNVAIHTDDFWPRQSFDRDVPTRGTRAVAVTRAYDAQTVGAAAAPSGGGSTTQ
jgi:ABC-type uncharacterized transport system auxiliary subunit